MDKIFMDLVKAGYDEKTILREMDAARSQLAKEKEAKKKIDEARAGFNASLLNYMEALGLEFNEKEVDELLKGFDPIFKEFEKNIRETKKITESIEKGKKLSKKQIDEEFEDLIRALGLHL